MVGGSLEMIDNTHPLAPPYPKGEEIPPDNCEFHVSVRLQHLCF